MTIWNDVSTAPEDEHVLLATTGGFVGEAIMLIDEDTGSQKWAWAIGPVHPNHVPLKWAKMPMHPDEEGLSGTAAVMRQARVALSFAFNRLHTSGRSRDTELCETFEKAGGSIEAYFKRSGGKL